MLGLLAIHKNLEVTLIYSCRCFCRISLDSAAGNGNKFNAGVWHWQVPVSVILAIYPRAANSYTMSDNNIAWSPWSLADSAGNDSPRNVAGHPISTTILYRHDMGGHKDDIRRFCPISAETKSNDTVSVDQTSEIQQIDDWLAHYSDKYQSDWRADVVIVGVIVIRAHQRSYNRPRIMPFTIHASRDENYFEIILMSLTGIDRE